MHRHRGAAHLESFRIERHGEQVAQAQEHQESLVHVAGIGGVLHEQRPRPGCERLRDDSPRRPTTNPVCGRCRRASWRPGAPTAACGPTLRWPASSPPLAIRPARSSRSGHRRGRRTGGRARPSTVPTEESRSWRRRPRRGRLPSAHLLDRVVRPEGHPSAVRRDRRSLRALGVLDRARLRGVEVPHVESLHAVLLPDENQCPTVRRPRQRRAGTARSGRQGRRVVSAGSSLLLPGLSPGSVGPTDGRGGVGLSSHTDARAGHRHAPGGRRPPLTARRVCRPRGRATARGTALVDSPIHRSSFARSWADSGARPGPLRGTDFTSRSRAGGVTGCSDETGGGSLLMIAEMTLASLSPANALRPVSIS